MSEAQDLIAHREAADVRADLGHDAGQIAALPGGEHRWPPLVQLAGTDMDLAGLDPGCPDLDQYLRGAGHRPRHVFHPQYIDPAVLVEPHRLHRVITASPRSDTPTTAAAS
jgi:hypothetical protein